MNNKNALFIDAAASDAFARKLQLLDISQLPLSEYDRKYLGHLISHGRYYCRIYAFLLNRAVAFSGLPPAQMVLMDYGAGNGLMGLMASEYGVGKVYINDSNPVFVQAARTLAAALGLAVDGFPEGDVCADPLPFRLLGLNAVVGFDVIEHIYDLHAFYSNLAGLHPSITVIMGTGANMHHPLKAREFRKLQYRDEYLGGSPEDFTLYGPAPQRAFHIQRDELIGKAFPMMGKEERGLLVAATRGLCGNELSQAVHRYVKEGVLPEPPADPYNTCDPVSGSWTERLLPVSGYRRIVEDTGLSFSFVSGFYNAFGKGLRYRMRGGLNLLIPLLGKRLAPFLVFSARGRGN
jgi:hypothetical protein